MGKTMQYLHDQWEFTWTHYGGKDRDILKPGELRGQGWYPAAVPGNTQCDLHKLEKVEDPFFAENADHLRWCEEADFWYRRKVGPVDLPHGARAILHFEGLDCFATIWIDGRRVGQYNNMFVPYWIDVTEFLRSDRPVEVMIRLAASFQDAEVSHRDPCNHPPIQRIRSRKAQLSYGWDIGPRIVTNGLWRPVRLEIIDRGRVLYAGARTVDVVDGKAKMELVATVDWHARPQTVKIAGQFGPVKIEKSVELVGGVNDVVIPFEIANPELWWPKGHGKPHLYEFELSVQDDKSKALDQAKGKFGVCKVEMLQEPRKDGCLGFRLKINNKDFFAKGINWTPCDSMFGRVTDERIRKLVKLSAEANVNMMRVWGGGVYEPESFMQACDEEGILVWQDFLFACSHYPQDNEFTNLIRDEAAKIARAYRGHVSMAVWSGDNEIDCCCGVEEGTLINRKVLPGVLGHLDPHRPYIVSSPFSISGVDANDPKYGDCHLWNHTIRPDDPFYTGFHANFVSEIGRISFPSQKTVDSFVPKEKQWPVENPVWFYHSSDTNRWGWYRNVTHVLECVKNNGYPEPKSLKELIEVSQKIQADANQFWIEHYGADLQCWGLILWNLCDCWPQVSDAVISYDLELKPAYFAIKEAYAKLKR
jgi:beta-mannosidase